MTYAETIDWLYGRRASYERQGASGYKPGLATSQALDELFGFPHRRYPVIHVAGTNGKGSVSHLLAAVLQSAGYRVGLYTSPHFVDFRERIRVDGRMISRQAVMGWMQRYLRSDFKDEPSFFELTSTMAFDYFARQKVDVAVVEVGLGGRLDSTNIVTPVVSVITNVSLDHTDMLGDTLGQIATEKAGIIKPGVPVVLGEGEVLEVRSVVTARAAELHAPLTVASDVPQVSHAVHVGDALLLSTTEYGEVRCQLTGDYQSRNANTVLTVVDVLRRQGFGIGREAVVQGCARVCSMTGLMGRWMQIAERPLTIADSGHNVAGLSQAMSQLLATPHRVLHIVFGMMGDKDVPHILPLLPREARYYFTQASTSRAMLAEALRAQAASFGLDGKAFPDVVSAYRAARRAAHPTDDVVYVGGSMYVLGELFAALKK